ncbi:MAG: hypothetical protein AAB389_00930 [Patescibacteria group bacterium]
MTKRLTLPLVIIGLAAIASFAIAQSASSETPYGGQRVYTLTCTCSGNALVYIFDYRTNSILSLVYQEGASILYSNYNVYGATYLLGTYSSGGASCKMYVGEDCVDINSSGQMGSQPGTGTS